MNELLIDLAAVVGKHADTLTAHEWRQACEQVAQGYFEAKEPQADDATERAIQSLRLTLGAPGTA